MAYEQQTCEPGTVVRQTIYWFQYNGNKSPVIFTSKVRNDKDFTFVGAQEIEYTIPADFNPVAAEVETLREARVKVVEEFTAKLQQIDVRLANLLSITL